MLDRLHGKIRPPDLVDIPHAGMLALYVKAESAHDYRLLFEVGEVNKLTCFGVLFHMTVSFVCLDLDELGLFYWVPLRALIGRY